MFNDQVHFGLIMGERPQMTNKQCLSLAGAVSRAGIISGIIVPH